MPAVVFNLGAPKTPFHLPHLPQFGARSTKLITAGAAIVISLSMVSFAVFSALTNNGNFKKSHGITSPTDDLESSNTTEKSQVALPGGGTASGVGGTTGTNSPVVTLTAQPASVPIGGKTHLKWSVTNNPISCTASDDWSGSRKTSGEEDSDPLTKLQTYIFTLTCKTATGTGFATVSVGAIQSGGTGSISSRPIVHLATNPSSVYQGQNTTLVWDTSNSPTACTASGDWSGPKATSGSENTATLSSIKSYTYTLTCTNSAGSGYATATVAAVALPPDIPVVFMSSSPASTVTPGNSLALTWRTSNSPKSCTASGDWSGSKSTSGGSQTIGPLTTVKSYTYKLTCTNESGSSYDSVVIDVIPKAPTVSFTLSPVSITTGSSATLTWSVTNSPTSCSASSSPSNANWSGAVDASGSKSTGTISTAGTYYFSLTCQNAGGTGSANNIALTVNAPLKPVVNVSISPITITQGGNANITWSATNNPTSCTGSSNPANASWNGTRTTNGTMSTGTLNSTGTYSFILTCVNAGGTGSASASLNVTSGNATSPPVVSISISPSSIGTGSSATITWSATNNPTSCSASGSAGTWVTNPSANGSATTGIKNTAGNFTYTLTCSNAAGSGSKTATLTVSAVPSVHISVSPSSITTGSNATVTWSASDSPTSCTASGNSYWSGSKNAAGGSQQVGPITAAGSYTFSMTCANSSGTSTLVSAPLTVTSATYCSGRTPCYGPNDLAGHNTVADCWGYNIDQVFDITSLNNNFHSNFHDLLPNSTSPLCGNASFASYLSGSSLSGVGSHGHQSSTKNNTNGTLLTYRKGYYDAAKP